MTLKDQAAEISRQAESLREKGAVLRQLNDVKYIQGEIETATRKILDAAEAMRALRSVDKAPSVDHKVFEQAADDVERMLEGERPSLVAKPGEVAAAMDKVAVARKSVTTSLQQSHSEWRDSAVGDLEPIVNFAEAVKKLWPEVHTEVTQLVSSVKEGRISLPTTESVRIVAKAVDRLQQIPRELAPTAETERFLVAACGSGATFGELTEPVRKWLGEKDLERRLRVRISGSADG